MHSVSDLTTSSRKTTGTVPPKLVGSSTTIVGDKMYLFGGRLVAERRMVADLYVFDLETFVWTKVPPAAGDDPPSARYFHSTDSWGNYLIIFGGMGHKPDAASSDDLVVLNDVRFLDITTFHWLPADPLLPSRSPVDGPSDSAADPIDPIDPVGSSSTNSSEFIPRARYAHLSSVTGSRLYIIGGQDLQNAWLDDICIFDLHARRWTSRKPYPRHAGTYRSVAVSAHLKVRDPAREISEGRTATGPASSDSSTGIGPPGGRFSVDRKPTSSKGEYTPSENLVHLPYSTGPLDASPNDIFLYSNYNFTDVKRELEVLTPHPGEDGDVHMSDRSSSMTGTVLPPGLRFPTGAICGNHLIFAGVYLAHSYQSYSIWALDLNTMTWSRLDPGAALAAGSWFRSALWNSQSRGTSKLLIFGNRQGSLVEDYNRRLLAWDDVAILDLEAFGIYQPPPQALDQRSQELGLAALEESTFADFELVCDDGRRIPCSRRMLEARWPWFRDQLRLLRDNAGRVINGSSELTSDANSAPPLPSEILPDSVPLASNAPSDTRPDPRMTPRALMLGEPYAIALALLQYLYTLALLTPLQHAPAVLSQLLLLGSTYNLPHLQRLVRHAMHRALVPSTSVGVYEVATLCGCQSLQIRALKAVMASSRRNTGRTRGNSNAGGPPPRGGSGSGGLGDRNGDRDRDTQGLSSSLRARGMSDVRGLNHSGSYNGPSGAGGTLAVGTGGPGETEANGMQMTATTNEVGKSPRIMHSRGDSDGRWPEDVTNELDGDVDGDNGQLSGEFGKMRRALQDEIEGTSSKLQSRSRHTVNLSMDSIYLALQNADENEGENPPESTLDPNLPPLPTIAMPYVPPIRTTSSSSSRRRLSPRISTDVSPIMTFAAGPNPPSVENTPVEMGVSSPIDSSLSSVRIQSPISPVVSPIQRMPESVALDHSMTVTVTTTTSPARRRAYSDLADLAIPSSKVAVAAAVVPPSPSNYSFSSVSPRSSWVVTPSTLAPPTATRLGYGSGLGLGSPDGGGSDSDGGVYASRSSISTNTRPSPLTPESPPLLTPDPGTPVFTHGHGFSAFALNAIDEGVGEGERGGERDGESYRGCEDDDDVLGEVQRGQIVSVSAHRRNAYLQLQQPPGNRLVKGGAAFGAGAVERESTYTSGSGSTNPSTTSSSSGHAYAAATAGMTATNTFVDVVIPERDEHVGWVDLSGNTPASTMLREMKAGVKVSPGERNVVGVPPMSPSASVESSEHSGSRVSLGGGGGGGFLSKAKIKRKKKGESAVTSTTGTVSSSSFSASVHSLSSKSHSNGYSGSGGAGGDSGWVDTKELKKAAKAEEKRRKKAEEKARLEKLAEQFSAGRQKGGATGDVTSVISSSGSSERRRAANEWIEDSVGMYGNMGFAAF